MLRLRLPAPESRERLCGRCRGGQKIFASEIKSLVSTVDISIGDVEQGTANLNTSISTSQDALNQSMENVDSTYEVFDQITTAAGGADTVHQQITNRHVRRRAEAGRSQPVPSALRNGSLTLLWSISITPMISEPPRVPSSRT